MLNCLEQMIEAVSKNFRHLDGLIGDGLVALVSALRHDEFYEPGGEISIEAKAENARTYTIKTVP
jgi:hypothetical protein